MKIQNLGYEFEIWRIENAPCDYLSRFSENIPLNTEVEEVNAVNPKCKRKYTKVQYKIMI